MTADQNWQVPDDPALLDEMMSGLRQCDAMYRPTNYWSYYDNHLLPELKTMGLKDFRRRMGSVLTSFGATDYTTDPIFKFVPLKLPFPFPGVGRINRLFDGIFRKKLEITSFYPADEVTQYLYWVVKKKLEGIGADIRKCPTSPWGNPVDLVEIDGALWSTLHLNYCTMWADASQHIEFKPDMIYCELGTGMGRQVEVLAQLYRDATFLMFDIPPQLYVAHQYLRQVFGPRVINYRDAVKLEPGADGNIPAAAKGKILLMPSWRLPAWAHAKADIFWNSASFQEMEPDVVENYLGLATRMRPRWIYITALPEGNWWGGWKPGKGGTKEQVKDDCYFRSLSGNYDLHCRYFTDHILRKPQYVSYIFRKKE